MSPTSMLGGAVTVSAHAVGVWAQLWKVRLALPRLMLLFWRKVSFGNPSARPRSLAHWTAFS